LKDRLAQHNLRQHTPQTPHINGLGVVTGAQQDFWSPVPPCGHTLSEHWTLVIVFGQRPNKPEVAELDGAVRAEENVAGLDIPVYGLSGVQVAQRKCQLIQNVLLVDFFQNVLSKVDWGLT
jgi:hypothetical protein